MKNLVKKSPPSPFFFSLNGHGGISRLIRGGEGLCGRKFPCPYPYQAPRFSKKTSGNQISEEEDEEDKRQSLWIPVTAGTVPLHPEGASHQGPPRLVRMFYGLSEATVTLSMPLRRKPIS